MSNKLDKQYTALLQDILDNGVEKKDRTLTGTLSVFGRQIRHKMSEGFPLLTTKKMAFKTMVTELLWFLSGDTNIKYLVDNDCHIWDGDAYKNYKSKINLQNNWEITLRVGGVDTIGQQELLSQEEFINKIKTDDEFAKKWGELGKIYGWQWRSWLNLKWEATDKADPSHPDRPMLKWKLEGIDQIANLINKLKTNPDSRRLMVNAWNVGELDQMVLPPCHYGFQVYTRELKTQERMDWLNKKNNTDQRYRNVTMDELNVPTRAISLMWNQRSCDFPLGIPMNIASYALLLMMIADEVNMVPDELIGNLGDCHIYLNQVDGVKEQIGRELTHIERIEKLFETNKDAKSLLSQEEPEVISSLLLDELKIPTRTREPYPLPTVHVRDGIFCSSVNDVILENYQSHPKIYFPLSN
jgi:thymidylate synthase